MHRSVQDADFDVVDFVDTVALSARQDALHQDLRPADRLLLAFDNAIAELWHVHEQVEEEVTRLEVSCRSQEERHLDTLSSTTHLLSEAHESLHNLGHGINGVALKIVHVGDQLENLKGKRDRCLSAARLIEYRMQLENGLPLSAPLSKLEPRDDIANADPDEIGVDDAEEEEDEFSLDNDDLAHAASIVQQLNYLCPTSKRLTGVRSYLESLIKHRFQELLIIEDDEGMHQLASVCLQHVPELYPKLMHICIKAVVRTKAHLIQIDPFEGIASIARQEGLRLQKIFESQPVTVALVQKLCKEDLKPFVLAAVEGAPDRLAAVHRMYKRTQSVLQSICEELNVPGGPKLGLQLTRAVFQAELDNHFAGELDAMLSSYGSALEGYYAGIGHEKVIGTSPRTPRKHARSKSLESSHIELSMTLLSDDLAAEMLDENRLALIRCRDLSPLRDAPQWPLQLFSRLLTALGQEHIKYALSVATKYLPPKKPKTEPKIQFFDVLRDVNKIFYLLQRSAHLQKHFQDALVPIIRDDLELYLACLKHKNEVMEDLEQQLASGVEVCLDAIIEWVKVSLTKERNKLEFRVEDAEVLNAPCTQTCTYVANFLRAQIQSIHQSLNGKNLTNVLHVLGVRLHKVIYESIKQFQYTILGKVGGLNTLPLEPAWLTYRGTVARSGGMLLARDLAVYEKILHQFSDPYINELLEVLRELCYLLIVKPENIAQLCSEGKLATLDQSVVTAFLHLRSDFKAAKITY
ncbi:uncharacterized protein MONBRDRAFT_23981 [Monosiga brevicollis MX1]|uniref:Uncharacterized protein n=1 Tax=Monosiga brevicollis TaxID=81824 RepID=A9UUC4_MONBE|nr:uncharacterized protein MONBRDRAFT_23981 [Monosiga brevicollis MX1]EDQ91071.1 predicted protein [Monosiga brevicollis MX1]|eukprot:XP_001744368.1 hypothetical protein [Monosiga brevicollis MX1]